jgi:large subunit ribosomal protein L30
MNKIKIKLVKSGIGHNSSIRSTLIGLGLRKIGDVVELENTPSIRGMVKKVIFMVELI